MRSTGVHHVDLVVSSIERSLPFYRDLLGPLGWHADRRGRGRAGETIWYLGGAGVRDRPPRGADAKEPIDRYGSACTTSRFEASSRDAVDERHSGSSARAATIEIGAAGVRLHPGLLRRLLLRPGRDQARDRQRAAARPDRRLGSPGIALGGNHGGLAALPDHRPARVLRHHVLDLDQLVPRRDDELGLVASHRLVVACGQPSAPACSPRRRTRRRARARRRRDPRCRSRPAAVRSARESAPRSPPAGGHGPALSRLYADTDRPAWGMTRDMSAGLDRGRLELYLPSAETAIGQARAAVDRLEA